LLLLFLLLYYCTLFYLIIMILNCSFLSHCGFVSLRLSLSLFMLCL
jgi:hypothetical protein